MKISALTNIYISNSQNMKKKFTCFHRIILFIGVLLSLLPAKAQNTYSDQYLDSVIVQVAQVLNKTKDWSFFIKYESNGPTSQKVTSVSPSKGFLVRFATKEHGDILVDFNQEIRLSTYNDCRSTNDPNSKGIWIGNDLSIDADLPSYLSCGTPSRIKAVKEGNERIMDLYQRLTPLRVRYEEQVKAYSDSVRAAIIAEKERKWIEFEKAAEEYKGSSIKPEISEEQRKYIVQANALTDDKKYREAYQYFEKVIEINTVSYPQAYFNMALLASQFNDFSLAIFNMKKYLILVPDAPDARAAQDKIYEWELQINK